jgi:DNA modification methylase
MKMLQTLKNEFEQLVGCSLELSPEYLARAEALCRHVQTRNRRSRAERLARLIASVNSKFETNRDGIAAVYAHAAASGVVFNFHEKNLIQAAFDSSNVDLFETAIDKSRHLPGLFSSLSKLFMPISAKATLARLRNEVESPSKLRIEKGQRPIGNEILTSAFSAFLFSIAEEQVMHEFFDSSFSSGVYEKSFWMRLRRAHPQLYSRTRTLEVVSVSQSLVEACGTLNSLRDSLFAHIAASYAKIENHGHLAFWIEPIFIEGRNVSWEICSDIMLYAEKHVEVKLQNAYFRSKQIEDETLNYLPQIPRERAQFDLANEGFTYKDTFVCPPVANASFGKESLLLLFQKNKRDETTIPCPSCRSDDVQGNSYSTLGVRSWECRNPLCPDRSKYNRGKRYSFKALLMQEAIQEVESQIPSDSVKRWSRDVQVGCTAPNAVEMLIRHYSLCGDGVVLFGLQPPTIVLGRKVSAENGIATDVSGIADRFYQSAWFRRYELRRDNAPGNPVARGFERERIGGLTLIHGDAADVLTTFAPNYFDGGVTSPPYFNAREYSQWPNMYCYLSDMQRIAAACFRVLKPGAPYLYNIFDYFDNERTITFSAMGDKRLILSAYAVDIFRRVGFTLAGSVTWDKGDIEGKRGFNSGNFSPYYQAPFNCWEHVLVFVKPGGSEALMRLRELPAVLRARPVSKMVRGQNKHGHSAPYPEDIPALLKLLVPVGGTVLDPFGGSATTARALMDHVVEAVCIEQMNEYCQLAARMYEAEIAARHQLDLQAPLFTD